MPDESWTESTAVILARMEVKLDNSLNSLNDHENRLRVLEKKVWVASGGAGLISGVAVAWATKLLGG